ncbi:MAG: DUF2723 domain-containing protein [Anaerolineales bacterium]
MTSPNRLIRLFPPGLLALTLMAVYLATLAPGLSWANYGSDGGDLITAAATGGIAHPTGYPFYLLLARLFQLLPVGSLAFRTNLLSAFATVSAALLIYGLVTRSLSASDPHRYWLAGLASGYAFGLSPLIWSQAVITEVYGLHALFLALLLYLTVIGLKACLTPKRVDALLGLTFGLAMGNHVTTIIMLPVILIAGILRQAPPTEGILRINKWGLDGRSLLRRLVWMGVGLLVYLSLPLRALSQPPVNWGKPVTIDGFLWLVSGKLYQGQLFVLSLSSIWERVKVISGLLVEQFGVLGLGFGLIGLILFYKPDRLFRSLLWIVAASVFFALAYATTDAFLYLIPAFLCFAIWIGMGLGGLMDVLSQRFRYLGSLITFVFILALFILAGQHWHQVDASHDLRAEKFGNDVFSLAPTDAIVFAAGDPAVFTTWYFQYTMGNRLDLAIVATDLLHFDWYQQMLHKNYPDLNVPGPFPFAETVVVANPERPVCFVEYVQMAEIGCLPPRNPTVP